MYFVGSFICQWTLGLPPVVSYCEWCCCECWCENISNISHLLHFIAMNFFVSNFKGLYRNPFVGWCVCLLKFLIKFFTSRFLCLYRLKIIIIIYFLLEKLRAPIATAPAGLSSGDRLSHLSHHLMPPGMHVGWDLEQSQDLNLGTPVQDASSQCLSQ